MESRTFTRDEMLSMLTAAYLPHYDIYEMRSSVAKDLIHDEHFNAHQAVSRLAARKSDFLDGFQAAVVALGISVPDFLEAVKMARNTELDASRAP